MMNNPSNIDELIKNHNPFAGHIVVRPQQIWGKSFPDVPSINTHASSAVFNAISKISQGHHQTIGITITAEKGLGKSHILSRIRHRLQDKDNTLFIYMSKYDNLNKIQHEFLQNVTSSLSRAFVGRQIMQWTEIASDLLNEISRWDYTPEQYVSGVFAKVLNKYSTKIVDQLAINIQKNKHNITNPYIIKAILWTLSPNHAMYANRWLSGLEITPEQAEFMGLPNPTKEDREAEALSTVRQILDLISDYRIPVICFDELDIADVADNGFTAAQIIANLVKDLYNNLKRGVLLLAMYPQTWNEQIRALPQADAVIDRLVSEQTNKQPIELKYLNSDDIITLVQLWLQDFYQEYQQTPRHSLYPFNEAKLRELGKGKPTIRSVLKWCAENFTLTDQDKPKTIHPVEPHFKAAVVNVNTAINLLLEDEVAIAAALRVAFASLARETIEVEGVKVERVEKILVNKADQGYLNFRIVGNNGKVKIGVVVIQQSGGKFIGAALKRLIEYEKFDLTRGCLVRSKKINSGASVPQECLKILLKKRGGEWVLLQKEDIKPLLAISSIYHNCRSYELAEEQIFDFIKQKQLATNNPLIREILSAPSGKIPDNLAEDELPISIPQNNSSADYIELNL
ncbi:hypothetical protein [Fortiea contorta]|uniref:hypothetical protein n=1 Tax=Fortiea contorta TaxID=1892405 RepID=UPI000477D249|nr:hypothetical protein [Fortiea contorta]